MDEEILYTWVGSESDKLKVDITKKVFYGGKLLSTYTEHGITRDECFENRFISQSHLQDRKSVV